MDSIQDILLVSYPYYDDRAYSIKMTLESKDSSYINAAHETLLGELARIDLVPVAGD
jgi:hypothetical protein